jgi:uncharacterized iron-regulated membrane protein
MTETAVSLSPGALRRLFGTLHLWIGVVIGIPAAVLGFTGIWLMAIHPLPDVASATTFAPVPSIDKVIAAAMAAAPQGAVPVQVDMAPMGRPVSVRFAEHGGMRVQVDPETLAIVPNAPASGINRIIHDLHGGFMAGREGRPLVGIVGLAMCGLCVSGLVLWWPRRGRWRAAFTVSGRGNTVMVLREIHGAAGIWGLIVFFIISFTGVVVAFSPEGSGAPGGGGHARPAELVADDAVAAAMAGIPNAVPRSVALPRGEGGGYRVTVSRIGDDRAVPPLVVAVDATGTQVESVHDSAEEALAWARPVHKGGAMGWVWWVLTLLSGALPIIFAVTGISMWLIKRGNRARVRATR